MNPPVPTAISRGLALVAMALLVAACASPASPSPSPSTVGGSQYSVFPVVVSEDLAPGPNRLLFVLVDKDNKPVSAPDRSVTVAIAPGDAAPSPSAPPVRATFQWGNEAAKQGYYIADVTFSQPGDWSAEFTTSGPAGQPEQVPYQFQVKDKHSAVTVGQPAPKKKTPTGADVGGRLAEVSTDTSPDPRFYELSEDQALAQHKPFVIVFATPAFCTSALCGPTLDRVKAISKTYPTVTFIHVEPYKMQVQNGHLQPILDANGQLQANDITNAWGLPAEPWAFVVDRNGIVQGSLDIVFSDAELKAAIDKVK